MNWKAWGGITLVFFLVILLYKNFIAPNRVAEVTYAKTSRINKVVSTPLPQLGLTNQIAKTDLHEQLCQLPAQSIKNFEHSKIQFFKKKATLWLLDGESRADVAATLALLVSIPHALDWYYSTINISKHSNNIGKLIELLDSAMFEVDTLNRSDDFNSLLSDFKISIRDILSTQNSVNLHQIVDSYLNNFPDITDSVFLYAAESALKNNNSKDAAYFITQIIMNDWNASVWLRVVDLYNLESMSGNQQLEVIYPLSKIGVINLPFQSNSPLSKFQMASRIFGKYENYFQFEPSNENKSSASFILDANIEELYRTNPLLTINNVESCTAFIANNTTSYDVNTELEHNSRSIINAKDYPELKSLCEFETLDYIDALSLFRNLLYDSNLHDKDLNKLDTWKEFDWNVLYNSLRSLNKNEQSTMISIMYSKIYRDNPIHKEIYKTFIANGLYVKEVDSQFFSIIMDRSSALEVIDLIKTDNYIEEKSGFGLPLIALISGNSQLSLQLMDKGYPISSKESSLLAGLGMLESVGNRRLTGEELDAQIEIMRRFFSGQGELSKWHINAMANMKQKNKIMFDKIYEHFPELYPYEPVDIYEVECD